jgi:hypothetical protein
MITPQPKVLRSNGVDRRIQRANRSGRGLKEVLIVAVVVVVVGRVGIRSGQSDAPNRVRPRFLGSGRVRTEGICSSHTGPGSGSVSSMSIVGRIGLFLSSNPANVGSDWRLSRQGRLFKYEMGLSPE